MSAILYVLVEFFKKNPRFILYLIAAILTAGILASFAYLKHENATLTKANTELTQANKSMKETIEKSAKSTKITEQTHTEIITAEKKVDDKKTEISDELTKKENDIRNKYQNKPVNKPATGQASKPSDTTPVVVVDDTKQMVDEIASVRIDSLNELYCTYADSDQTQCKKE